MHPLALLLALFAALIAAPAARAQTLAPGEKAMAVSLVAETAAPAPGGRVTLALVMKPRPGWHGYWENPGDAGMPNRIAWRLPAGVVAGTLRYPVPQRLVVAGLMNYVYEGEHAELVELTIPPGLAAGTALPVRARIDYLVCTDEICVPENAEVAVDLRVGDGRVAPDARARFDSWREALPKPLGSPARFQRAGGELRLAIPLPAMMPVSEAYFFPLTDGAARYSAAQRVSRRGDLLIVETEAGAAAPAAVAGVLKIGTRQGLALSAAPGPVSARGATVGAETAGGAGAIVGALLGALLGGLLLNVMPCVFPILSLKALSLARAGGGRSEARREALAYSAGVILVCVALGAGLLALRSAGVAAGWAFQLQDPRVILFLLLLVTAIGLNLAGLFELPSVGGARPAGAFWTGALAAFVATPCTGPFMGAALGAALVLPMPAALAVFAGLGLGLALPFLLLGFVPALRGHLPRPGPWMLRFRRILAVPMFLTALGLAWVLERQAGLGGLGLGLGAAIVVGAALWWAGQRHGWPALVPAAVAMGAAVLFLPSLATQAEARARGALDAEPFSEARLAKLRAERRPVFVYFTADWCLTCKVNEQAVLERDEVARAFRRRKVAVLVGDWTKGDAEIGRFLERHGRSGVPLYLWYAPGKEPRVLPQILTIGGVTALGS
ncbi:MAG TPA: thioredoxin family protein [Allosphingosinicella sp.]